MVQPVIWWIRRDLRLGDHPALQAAAETGAQVIPLFILDEHLARSRYVGEKRLAFLYGGLRNLDVDLRRQGNFLVLRQGDPLRVLTALIGETGAVLVFAEPDYSPYAARRDQLIDQALPLQWVGSPAALPPGFVSKPDGNPYIVFTPFSKAWKESYPVYTPSPAQVNSVTGHLLGLSRTTLEKWSVDLPSLRVSLLFQPGEAEAIRRLEQFTSPGDPEAPVYRYGQNRDALAIEGTSALSPYLRFGMLSVRRAVASAYTAIQAAPDSSALRSAETWLNELIWRDFYIHILAHFPHVRRRNFRQIVVDWRNDPADFQAWADGQTGYPIVDAAMRQLYQTGWMPNRARMITASFLTKDLLVDWRQGEAWFMQHLLDGDPASNNGGWQWTAGTGVDAAPYFRVFNPILQSQKNDPQGCYIRRWLPELANLPDAYIHQPWQTPAALQREMGLIIGRDYPHPIVDHAFARQRLLAAFHQT